LSCLYQNPNQATTVVLMKFSSQSFTSLDFIDDNIEVLKKYGMLIYHKSTE